VSRRPVPGAERSQPKVFSLSLNRAKNPVFRKSVDQQHTDVVNKTIPVWEEARLATPKLSKLEFQIMEALWAKNEISLREIQESFPAKKRPAYTTIQTTVYRMEAKGIVRRVRKVGNFHLFSTSVTRDAAQHRLIDDLLALFGGRTQPVMAHLIESGKLSLADVQEAEKALRQISSKEK
jgi:predicted transcriptional regulator